MMIMGGPSPYELIREAQKRKFELIEKFWGSIDRYVRFKEYVDKRKEFLERLYLIYPLIEIQAANWDESIRTEWRTCDYDLVTSTPIIHYKVLPCELVFDFESKDKEQLKILVDRLKSYGVTPFIASSGNRGFHLHVLFTAKGVPIEKFAKAVDLVEFRNALFEYILDSAKAFGLNEDLVDSGVMRSTAHLIRSVYSFNPKGKQWKLPLFGEFYPIWEISKGLVLSVREYISKKRERKQIEELVNEEIEGENKVEKKPRGPNKIKWIEQIIQQPEKVKDGRKRLLLHAIIPYFVTVKGMSEEEVMMRAGEWVEKTGAEINKYRSFIRCQVKLAKRKRILPMRKEKFFGLYADLGWLCED
jgi:hypothetical protein